MNMTPEGDPDYHLARARSDYASAFNAGQRAGWDAALPAVLAAFGAGGLFFPLLGLVWWPIGFGLATVTTGLGIWWAWTDGNDK
jgi:hypothetical protein